MINKIVADDITKEKNLWDVYLLCRKISISTPHLCIMLSATIFLFINAFFIERNLVHLLSDIRNWSTVGFNFAVTTLGFLIAGFTIFATLSKPDMFLTMMAIPHKDTKMPTLKYNFMAFMKVFIAFIICTFIYLFIILFCQTNGITGNIIKLLPNNDIIKSISIKITYCIVGVSLIYLVLVVKTFIFNIYAIVMHSIRWELYLKKKEAKQKGNNKVYSQKDAVNVSYKFYKH
ncbi:hypothetical protein ACNAUL_05745 [Raoultella ornithinolytica]|uniref:hypothetical protein n=1 Tax=Raoultella ornithinolytica TaxID=54291 RepID=UPI00330A017B|nr:hypothetical protein [Raoultella ornithinolytica]